MDERYQKYVEGMDLIGKEMLSFSAPCCGKEIKTLPALDDEPWTPLASCPHCGCLYRKIVTKKSAIGVLLRETLMGVKA